MDIRNQMDEFARRLKEMEDSVELIAQYVKKETIASRELIASKEAEKLATIQNLVSEISASLKKDIDSIHREIKESSMKQSLETRKFAGDSFESIRKLEADIQRLNGKIEEIEAKIGEKEERKAVDYENEIQELQKKINDVSVSAKIEAEKIRRELREFISNQKNMPSDINAKEEIERLQTYINDSGRALASQTEKIIKDEVNRLENLIHDSMKLASEEAEGKMQKEVDRLENLIYDSGKLLTEQGMEQYLEKIGKLKGNLERYFNVKTQLLENRIKELSEMVKSLESNRDYLRIEENLANLEAKINNDISKIREGNIEAEKLKTDVENIKSSLKAIAPEADIIGMEKALSSIRQKLDILESKDDGKIQSYIQARIDDINRDIAQAREKLEENMKKMSLDFTYKINQMKKTIEEEAEKFKKEVDDKTMNGLRREVSELKKIIEEHEVNRISMEKKIEDLENMFKASNALEEAEEIKRAIEEDQVNRASLEKKVSDLESNISSLKNKLGFIATLKKEDIEKIQKDIEKFQETLNGMEKEMHIKAMNVVMQQLHEFSEALDKRMPDLVGREEFLRSVKEIKSRTGTQVDMTKFSLRLENVERQLEKIISQMSSLHGRLPFVVE